MDFKFLNEGYDESLDLKPSMWYSEMIKIKENVVIKNNKIVICFERFSCWDDIDNTHDYLKQTDGIRQI